MGSKTPLVLVVMVLLHLSRTAQADITGNLTVISDELSLEMFEVRGGGVNRLYYTEVQLGEDEIRLHETCPHCDKSYTQYVFNDRQVFLPSESQQLYTITVINHVPYVQAVHTPGCLPMTIFGPAHQRDKLYLQCRNPNNPEQVLLARLVQDGDRNLFVDWTYERFPVIDTLMVAGSFYEYFDLGLGKHMVALAYTRDDVLLFEEPINNFLWYVVLPEECAQLLRITPFPNLDYRILLECSGTAGSSIITSLHIFDPDVDDLIPLLRDSYSDTSPVHLLPSAHSSDTLVVIFTENEVIIQSVDDEGVSARVPTSAPIYDGAVTTVGERSFAVYTSSGDLYSIDITQQLEDPHAPWRLPLRDGVVCTDTGCPLMEFIDPNTVVVALNDSRVVIVILTPQLKLMDVIESTDPPKRFVFLPPPPRVPTTTPTPPTPSVQPSVTPSTSGGDHKTDDISVPPTENLRPTVTPGPDVGPPNKKTSDSNSLSIGDIVGMTVGGVVAAVIVVVSAVFVVLRYRKKSSRKLPQYFQLCVRRPMPEQGVAVQSVDEEGITTRAEEQQGAPGSPEALVVTPLLPEK